MSIFKTQEKALGVVVLSIAEHPIGHCLRNLIFLQFHSYILCINVFCLWKKKQISQKIECSWARESSKT